MVSMSDELKERNILKLILIMRFACATLDVGRPMISTYCDFALRPEMSDIVHQLSKVVDSDKRCVESVSPFKRASHQI
jgi:hypothetical protein